MFKRSKEEPQKPVNLDLNFPREEVRAPIFEHFAGREMKGPLYNVAGCKLPADVVLVRTYKADPFRLAVKIGEHWYELAKVRRDDPGMKELYEAGRIVEYGPTPQEIEDEKKREAERQEREDAENRIKESRRLAALERERKWQEKRQRAIEERRAGM